MRELHRKIGAIMSLILVVFSGGVARGGETMSTKKNTARSTPRVYTSKSGRRFARTSDVLRSASARAEIGRYLKLSKDGKAASIKSDATARNK
jgi:hypothetical protein